MNFSTSYKYNRKINFAQQYDNNDNVIARLMNYKILNLWGRFWFGNRKPTDVDIVV